MSRRTWWIVTGLVAVSLLGAWLVGGRSGGAGPSVLSAGTDGWLVARTYLERRGRTVELLARPLDRLPRDRTLVTAFPWQGLHRDRTHAAFRHHVVTGGTLVVGYSRDPAEGELRFLDLLGLSSRSVRAEAPVEPLAWRRHVSEEWTLDPLQIPSEDPVGPVVMRAANRLPFAPADSRPWYRRAAGGDLIGPVIFEYDLGQGRVVLVPAEALSNGRLATAGNADLLESLWSNTRGVWVFDEYNHGYVASQVGGPSASPWAFDLFALHLAILYGLGLMAVARRFGPAWKPALVRSGSPESFLFGVGELHARLGHHRQAGDRLVKRVQELQPALSLPETLVGRAGVRNGRELLELAQKIGSLRAGKKGSP